MEGSILQTKSKINQTVIALTASVLGIVALPDVAARVAEPAIETRFQCDSPDIVAQFVAARYPQDVFLIERALRDGTCVYSDTPTPVTPVHFVLPVAAGENSAQSTAHIWKVRFPDVKVGYTYFWSAEHESMLYDQRSFNSSVVFPQ